MESKTKPNKKQNKMRQRRITDSDEEDITLAKDTEPRVVLTAVKGHSRDSSVSSSTKDDAPKQKTATRGQRPKARMERANRELRLLATAAWRPLRRNVKKDLERFLFEKSYKINRPAIRFILEK